MFLSNCLVAVEKVQKVWCLIQGLDDLYASKCLDNIGKAHVASVNVDYGVKLLVTNWSTKELY